MKPALSVVIRVQENPSEVSTLLRSIDRPEDVELIAVATRPSAGFVAFLEELGLRVVVNERPFGYGLTLNLGFAAAEADWVLCLSTHCIPLLRSFLFDWLSLLHRMPNVALICAGKVVQAKSSIRIGDDLLLSYGGASSFVNSEFLGNPNCLYNKSVWRARPFSEQLAAGEDKDMLDAAEQFGFVCGVYYATPVLYRPTRSLWYFLTKGYKDACYVRSRKFCASEQLIEIRVPFVQFAKKAFYRFGFNFASLLTGRLSRIRNG